METFSLVLNSSNSTNRTGTLLAYVYQTDWARVIPPAYKHRKFDVTWTFRSDLQATSLPETMLVYCDIGFVNCVDQSGAFSNLLGAIVPGQFLAAAAAYGYSSDNDMNNRFSSAYPSNQNVAVTLTDITNATVANYNVNYILQLFFTLIPEE